MTDEWVAKKKQEVNAIELPDTQFAVKFVVVHHSLTKDGKTVNWEAIKRYHVEDNGWSDIGYHAGVELVGDEFLVLRGRPFDRTGAHCKDGNVNKMSLGVCMVGNFDIEVPPVGQWVLGLILVRRLCDRYLVPFDNVIGHREAQENSGVPVNQRKSCPGILFNMNKFRFGLESV